MLCFASLKGTLRAFLSWLPFSCFLLLERWEKEKKTPTIYFLKLHLQLLKDKTSPWDCGRFQTLPPAQAEKAVFSPVSARYEAVGNTSGTEAQAKMLPSGAGLLRRKIAARNVIT